MNQSDIFGFSWNQPKLPAETPVSVKQVVFRYMTALVKFVFDASALEGNPLTKPEVKTIGDGLTVSGHRWADVQQVQNLFDASNELTNVVQSGTFRLDKHTSDRLHALVAKKEALEWGHFRGEGEEVSLTPDLFLGNGRAHTPPPTKPGAENLKTLFTDGVDHLESAVADPRERAMAYFLFGALQQFYFNGNKRTARFMMNGVLMSNGYDAISVPEALAQEFNSEMIQFCTGRDATRMMSFLIGCRH